MIPEPFLTQIFMQKRKNLVVKIPYCWKSAWISLDSPNVSFFFSSGKFASLSHGTRVVKKIYDASFYRDVGGIFMRRASAQFITIFIIASLNAIKSVIENEYWRLTAIFRSLIGSHLVPRHPFIKNLPGIFVYTTLKFHETLRYLNLDLQNVLRKHISRLSPQCFQWKLISTTKEADSAWKWHP